MISREVGGPEHTIPGKVGHFLLFGRLFDDFGTWIIATFAIIDKSCILEHDYSNLYVCN